MSKVEESIELEVPVQTAYNQWTQFEEFPRFMEHVDEVRQLDDEHLHWRATVAGKTEEWDARDHRTGAGHPHRLEEHQRSRQRRGG